MISSNWNKTSFHSSSPASLVSMKVNSATWPSAMFKLTPSIARLLTAGSSKLRACADDGPPRTNMVVTVVFILGDKLLARTSLACAGAVAAGAAAAAGVADI